MGFCSGTDIFDPVAKVVLETPDTFLLPATKRVILKALIDALEDHDWDCESDSQYWNHPMVREVFMEMHPGWFEDDD